MLATADVDLPSLPQVVLHMLKACDDQADFAQLSELISRDTALTARVLTVANSCYFHRHTPVHRIQEALFRLGTQRLRSLALTVALQEFLQSVDSQRQQALTDFWRYSLSTALLARAIAELTAYPEPEEAFLTGILHNAGQLIELSGSSELQLTREDISELGAEFTRRWGMSRQISEAIAHQHAPLEEILDHAHLVKIISLSTRLARSESGAMDAAHALFGLTIALTREICQHVDREVKTVARSLSIPLQQPADLAPARAELLAELMHRLHQQLPEGTDTSLPEAADPSQLRALLHEINNPLTVIRNYLSSLTARFQNDRDLQSKLDVLQEELDRVGNLLLQAHDISVMDRDPGPADLAGECHSLLAVLEDSLFHPHQIDCLRDIPATPISVNASAGAIRQILINLTRNAVEAMPNGGKLTIRVQSPLWQSGQSWAALSAQDNGPGLPKDVEAGLFRPLTTNRHPGHRGLGLSIVKQLVDDMGAIISCHSSGQGTEFRILLPLAGTSQDADP